MPRFSIALTTVLTVSSAFTHSAESLPKLPVESDGFEFIEDDDEHQSESRKIDKLSMLEILDALKASTPEHLSSHLDKNSTFKDLMLHPVKYRGHVVSFDGTFRYKYEDPLEVEGEGGKLTLDRGQISAGGNLISVASLEPFPATLKSGDTLRFTGIFLKRFAFLNNYKPGSQLTWTPLVFVKKLEPYTVEAPPENPAVFLGYIVFVMVGVGFFFLYNSKKEASLRRSNYFSQLKSQRDGGERLFPGAKKK